ncbi:hypothetical protein [Humidesulfovibrio mexicanus]|uniref:hypothetical protein n=1 Tax=Humidesulfovibrio mexicanus TaxID=147047 RepID=UPI000B7799F9|nr:hypothetical protein [Humidesulfovibrio mexicanus]
MSVARWIESRGVRVWAEGDALTLEGLAALEPEKASEVLTFARQNKKQLLEELGRQIACRGCGMTFTPSDPSKVYCRARCFNTMRRVLQ